MSSYAKIYYDIHDGEEVHMIPVGVALWNSDAKTSGIRFIRDDEALPWLPPAARSLIATMAAELGYWMAAHSIPGRPSAAPWSNGFWLDVQSMMVHRVRLGDPLAIIEDDLESLFQAIVKPLSPTKTAMPPKIDDLSWLKKHEAFVKGYEYAATQNKAIPALSKCSPEEMFFAYEAIKRGFDRAVDIYVNGGPSA